jgi:tRNA A-37 threonylcarbamoyl transferase component Bud32/tetratricopeptide (TPR) repeat protein
MEGRRFGRYRITSKLAEGGMGAVYLATHELMGREVVIKVLLPEMSTQRDIVQRFFNEARTTANLEHPGIVAIFDLEYADDGRAYIVMERLRGENLHERLRRVGRLSVEQSVEVTRQLASAIGAAHAQGIVHRDLKPGNIFLIPDRETPGRERVKVLDFGVAKLALHQSSLVTHQGTIFGTPPYMAPEQCVDAAAVDHRADLYALGCILYECLCGRPPFVGGTIEVLAAQLRDVPEPPRRRNPEVPPWLDSLVMRLLEKASDSRIQSCTALLEALDAGTRSWAGTPGRSRSAQETAVGLPRGQGQAPTMGSITGSAAEMGTARGGGSRRVWIGVSAAVVAMVAVGAFIGLQDANRGPTVTDTPASPNVPGPGKDFDGAMREAWAALGKRDWQVAEGKGREALALAASDPVARQRAQQVIDRAARESGIQLRFDALREAVARKDYARLKAELAAIDKTSAYYTEAQAAHDSARDSYVRKMMAKAEELLEQRKCPAIRTLESEANALWPNAGQRLGEMAEACRKAAVTRTQTSRPSSPPPPPPDEPDEPEPVKTVDELVVEAQDAAFKGQYGRARRLCEQALEVQPREPRAISICATSACGLGNERLAKRYYVLAQGDERRMIQQLCSSKGIELEPKAP